MLTTFLFITAGFLVYGVVGIYTLMIFIKRADKNIFRMMESEKSRPPYSPPEKPN